MGRALAALVLLALLSTPALAADQNPLPEGVCETTLTTGTGTLTLAGALQNYRTFASAVTTGNSVKYNIVTGSGATRKTETGEGVFTSPSTLTRTPSWSSDGVATALSLTGTSNVCIGWNSGWATEGTWGINAEKLAGTTPGSAGLTVLGWTTAPNNLTTSSGVGKIREAIIVALSDESTTLLTTGTGKAAFNMPYAFTLTSVRCSVTTVQTAGSLLTFNIKENGTTILSTNITIDNSETSSATAATPPVISDTELADNSVISFDIVTVGTAAAKGAKCYLIGNQ
jgi:hypothetical protein